MRLLHGLSEVAQCQGGYVSIGNFDGVHLGHRAMISQLIVRARLENVPAVVFTFEPHPISIMRPESTPGKLTTLERKAQLLGECGADFVIAYPTDWPLLKLTPDQFFQSIVLDQLQARGLVEGENFYYGANRAGNVQTLRNECSAAGLSLDIVSPIQTDGNVVSSSSIRRAITEGNMTRATTLLGSFYRIQGIVKSGAARGRQLGFPTANLANICTELPRDGVYAGIAHVADQRYRAAINIGPNPTFGEGSRKVEVHLLNFHGDLYEQLLDVDIVTRLRDTRPFQSINELIIQLQADVATVSQEVTL